MTARYLVASGMFALLVSALISQVRAADLDAQEERGSAAAIAIQDDTAVSRIEPPPASLVKSLSLSPFYKKHLGADGFVIVASEHVSDFALAEAAYLVDRMLDGRSDIRRALAASGVRLAIMSPQELTTTVPEHSDLKPREYWDRRARGLGATPHRPAVSCGEENLLCYAGDPYATENILIHEFAHAIHQMGLNTVDPTFDRRLKETYAAAMTAGLWKNKYAANNHAEYWAEGVQSWFDTNREDDHDHNHVNTREELKEYDPQLAMLIAEVLGDSDWRYRRPADREASQRKHLAGYDPASAPRFQWPAEVRELRGKEPE